MSFFSLTRTFKTNEDVEDKIKELYKLNPDIFSSESQVIRSTIIKFYNDWAKGKYI